MGWGRDRTRGCLKREESETTEVLTRGRMKAPETKTVPGLRGQRERVRRLSGCPGLRPDAWTLTMVGADIKQFILSCEAVPQVRNNIIEKVSYSNECLNDGILREWVTLS